MITTVKHIDMHAAYDAIINSEYICWCTTRMLSSPDVPCCKNRVDSARQCYQPIVCHGHAILAVWLLSLFWVSNLAKKGMRFGLTRLVWNNRLMLGPGGSSVTTYDKVHLVSRWTAAVVKQHLPFGWQVCPISSAKRDLSPEGCYLACLLPLC